MKNWYKFLAVSAFILLFQSVSYAQVPPAAPQKDEKRTLTIMTQEEKSVEIKKRDLLNDLFTPVGDVTYGIIKGASDLVGAGCGACMRAFDETMSWMLTPLGFKPEPSERRAYIS